jgi:hypothetical protein
MQAAHSTSSWAALPLDGAVARFDPGVVAAPVPAVLAVDVVELLTFATPGLEPPPPPHPAIRTPLAAAAAASSRVRAEQVGRCGGMRVRI